LLWQARAALRELNTALLASGGGEERERNAEVADAAGGGGDGWQRAWVKGQPVRRNQCRWIGNTLISD